VKGLLSKPSKLSLLPKLLNFSDSRLSCFKVSKAGKQLVAEVKVLNNVLSQEVIQQWLDLFPGVARATI